MRASADLEWVLEREVCSDFDRATGYEWLETNGLGGWASSTAVGAHTRRYHGLLVAATAPPVGRMVLLSRLDETVLTATGRCELAANQYPGTVHPRGFEHLERFRRALFPSFEYACGGVRLRKTVAAVNGENTTLVLYEVLAAPGRFLLELRPFFAGRDYHAVGRANPYVHRDADFARGTLAYQSYDGVPRVFLRVPGSAYRPAPDWYHDFVYARERERGLEDREDLFTPGALAVELAPGARLGVIASTADPAGWTAFDLLAVERRRREAVVAAFGNPDPLCRALCLAADAFVVRRGEGLRTVIAGYHWFSDWGRDTMVALPGLCLVTRRFDEARSILRAFARAVSQGMLPNRFPDRGEPPEYNTVDAALWFFVAVWRYVEASGDETFVRHELTPVLEEILAWHDRGTRHGIHVEADGLLAGGESGMQLTWMDARVGDQVVTPRIGKPVEVAALWANALWILGQLVARAGRRVEAGALRRRARAARQRFAEVFWNADTGYLYDCIDGEGRDASLRPNQIFALALPFPLLGGERAESVLRTVEAKLLTPRGLRTLAADDPRYRGICAGSAAERDAAYHQGTVWPWLLGPYLTALVRLRGEAGRAKGRELLAGFAPHLGEAGLGTVSEIFDGDAPHAPRGAIAQAWSVAELLRAAVEDLRLGTERDPAATTVPAHPAPFPLWGL
jgi:predicted glycogen debranching enzyme